MLLKPWYEPVWNRYTFYLDAPRGVPFDRFQAAVLSGNVENFLILLKHFKTSNNTKRQLAVLAVTRGHLGILILLVEATKLKIELVLQETFDHCILQQEFQNLRVFRKLVREGHLW